MRAVVMRKQHLVVADLPLPTPGPGEVLVKTLACGICGSDLHALKHAENFVEAGRRAGSRFVMDLSRDVVMGHEFCAAIVEHGPETRRHLPRGTRVCSRPGLVRPDGVWTVGYSNDTPGGYARSRRRGGPGGDHALAELARRRRLARRQPRAEAPALDAGAAVASRRRVRVRGRAGRARPDHGRRTARHAHRGCRRVHGAGRDLADAGHHEGAEPPVRPRLHGRRVRGDPRPHRRGRHRGSAARHRQGGPRGRRGRVRGAGLAGASREDPRRALEKLTLGKEPRMRSPSRSLRPILLGFALVPPAAAPASTQPPARGHGAEAHDMELVGHDDLQGRSAYQPTIHQQSGRVIAYVGHHGGRARNPLTGVEEDNGTSIVDATDPAKPRYLVHIAGAPGSGEQGGAQMARVCDRQGKTYLLRTIGNSVPNSGHEVWNVTDPAKPQKTSTVVSGLTSTHKNWWECDTGIAYLVSGDLVKVDPLQLGPSGWRTWRMTKIYDLSDPAKPVFVREFGL